MGASRARFFERRDFVRAWQERFGPVVKGVESTYPSSGMFRTWRRQSRQTGIGAGEWLDSLIPERVYAKYLAETEDLKHYDVMVLRTRARVVERPDGQRTWRYESGNPPHFLALDLVEREVTVQQLRAGEEPWFPEKVEVARVALREERAHVRSRSHQR